MAHPSASRTPPPPAIQGAKAVPPAPSNQPPQLLDRFADALHQHQYIPALIHDYVDWVQRFIYFNQIRHPEQLGMVEVQAFLDYQAGAGGAALLTLDFFASCEEFLGESDCVSNRVMQWWEANYPAADAARLDWRKSAPLRKAFASRLHDHR